MSTRSIIACVGEHEGQFRGRYVHADGMPTSMGATLWSLFHGHFKNDLSVMLAYLIDAPHAQCGWSALVGKDFSLTPGYTWQKATADGAGYEVYSKRPDYRRPQCFAGRPGEEPYTFTHEDLKDNNAGLEWLYVFDEEENRLYVRDLGHGEEIIVELKEPEPEWTAIECGENFERCGHYGWVHGLAPKTSNLSTQTWLGRRPLEFHDAVAFIIGGKRYTNTGGGGNSDYLNQSNGKQYRSNAWIATVRAGNGRRLDVPVAKIVNGKYTPFPGVTWVMPGTRDNPEETVQS